MRHKTWESFPHSAGPNEFSQYLFWNRKLCQKSADGSASRMQDRHLISNPNSTHHRRHPTSKLATSWKLFRETCQILWNSSASALVYIYVCLVITLLHVTSLHFFAISLMDNHHYGLTMTNSDKTQHFIISQMHWITEINQYRSTSIDGEIAGLQMMLLQTTCDKLT